MVQYIACDVETQNLSAAHDPNTLRLSIAFYGETISAAYPWEEGLDVMREMRKHNSDIIWIFHNAAFDVSVLRLSGINIRHDEYEDTMVMSYVLRCDNGKYHGLDYLSEMLLGMGKLEKPKFQELTEATPELLKYNLRDTKLTYKLFFKLLKLLEKNETSLNFYTDIELPYVEIIMMMQMSGVVVDIDKLHTLNDKCDREYLKLYRELHQFAPDWAERHAEVKSYTPIPEPICYRSKIDGEVVYTSTKQSKFTKALFTSYNKTSDKYTHCTYNQFNPNSANDKMTLLTELYDCEFEYTDKGNPKLDKQSLEELGVPLADKLCEYTGIHKLKTAFFNPLVERTRTTNVIHPKYNQCTVRTNRLSSSNPNIQQIPSRGDWGNDMRSMFVAPEGYKVIVGDLDRIELAVLAFYLEVYIGYSGFADKIRAGIDVHEANRQAWSEVIGQELERKYCKNGIFARNYGCGDRKFAATLNHSPGVHVTVDDIKVLMAKDELMSSCTVLKETLVKECKKRKGRIYNWFGCDLYIPEIMSRRQDTYLKGERLLFNYMIQSTAGAIFKILQLNARYDDFLIEDFTSNKLYQVLAVHDEAGYYGVEHMAHYYAEHLTSIYTTDQLLRYEDRETTVVPVTCKFNVGDNWLEAKGE